MFGKEGEYNQMEWVGRELDYSGVPQRGGNYYRHLREFPSGFLVGVSSLCDSSSHEK